MWGSTKANTPDECTWTNAPFNNGSSSYNKTYFNSVKDSVCPNNVLAKEYDTATQVMGGDWRMPTIAEINELLSKTYSEWIDGFNGSGINGMKFTSKTDESKYIFIPAAGSYNRGSVNSVGSNGRVWSSSLNGSTPNIASAFYFNSGDYDMSAYDRYIGYSVRGVCE